MRKFTAGLVVVGLVSLSLTTGWSKGIFVYPGAKASSMGAAFTAIADDATAIYYNPAGLVHQKKPGVSIQAFYASANATSNSSLANVAAPNAANGDFPLQNLYGAFEPSMFNSKEFKTSALIPFVAGYGQYSDITFAVGYYGTGGGGGKWSDTVGAVTASVEGSQAFLAYNISAAKEISHQVSVGLGVDLIQQTYNNKANKQFTPSAGLPLPAYEITAEQSNTGNGFQFNGGLLYTPMDNLRAGLVFRSGTTIKLSGKATVSGIHETNFDSNYYYPITYGAGVAYDPLSKLTLALAVEQNVYSSAKTDITYASPSLGLGLVNTNTSNKWNDTTNLRLGAEYRYDDKWAFRGGVHVDPTPEPRTTLTLLDTLQYNHTYLTLGAGYAYNSLAFDLTVGDALSDKPSLGGREYEYGLFFYQIAARYRFK